MRSLSFRYFLFTLNTDRLRFLRKASLIAAFSRLSLPHFDVESISMQSFFSGIKKSTTYLSIGYWNLKSTLRLLSILENSISCGRGFLKYVLEIVFALLHIFELLKEGLSAFIFSECHSKVLPKAQWFAPLFGVSCVASLTVRVFKFNFLATLVSDCLETPLLFDSSLREIFCSICKSLMILLKGILKNASSLSFTEILTMDGLYLQGALCQE